MIDGQELAKWILLANGRNRVHRSGYYHVMLDFLCQ